MGWCSATSIMDTALKGAEAAVLAALMEGVEKGHGCCGPADEYAQRPEVRQAVDDALRPFVALLAGELRGEDWDCQEDSDYFERFPQEMMGWDDERYRQWLMTRLGDAQTRDEAAKWSLRLADFDRRMNSDGR